MQENCKWQPEASQETVASGSEILAVDADFAEADQDAAAGLRDAEAHLRAEAGEHHHLVELVVDGRVVRAGEDGVGDHLALRVDDGFDGKDARIIEGAGIDAGNLKVGEALESSGLDEIQREIVWNDAAHRDADENVLQDQHERDESGEHTTGGGHGNRAKNVFESENRARPQALKDAEARLNSRSLQTDTKRKIGRDRRGRDARKADGQTAIVLHFAEAFAAIGQMRPDALVRRRGNRAVEVSGKMAFGLCAIHFRPPCAFATKNEGPAVKAEGVCGANERAAAASTETS